MDDEILLDLYAKFQVTRRSLGVSRPQARYDDFINRGRYQGSALPVPMIADHHMLDLSNALNRFHYDLHGLEAWRSVLAPLSEAEKMQALFEFVFPLASHSLSAPYSIKQKLITSIYQVSHQSKRFRDDNWKDGLFDKRANFPDAQKAAKDFSQWPALSDALATLNSDAFVNTSDDHRRRFHHGFPAGIESGRIMTVKQESPGSSSYMVRELPPLLLNDIVPMLGEQYDAAFRCYGAYVDLIKEQEKIWPA